nr:hypothetical protein [Tanacetum cinerariifolium]
ERQMQMVGGNQVIHNAVQNLRVQSVGNHNGLIGVQGNGNQNHIGNGNLVAARAEGNTQLLIAQKEEAGIQLQAEEYDLMAAVADLDEIKEVNTNCILMANLQLASTSEEKYTELLEPIFESHQVPQNDNEVISKDTSVEHGGETVEQHPANFEETHFSDDTTPSVARKFLNEVKSTIVTLQRVVKQRIAIETHNWSSSTHQELHKNEAAKFVGDFKSLANEADASLAKHKALELEIKRLLKEVVSQDIMIIVKNESVVDTSYLQTELERVDNTKTRRPQPMRNTKNDRVLSASKSSQSKNKGEEVEEHHRNLLLSKNKKHMSSACNNFMLDSQNVYSKVACAIC